MIVASCSYLNVVNWSRSQLLSKYLVTRAARAAHILYKHSTNGNCENWKMTTFEDIIHLLFTLWSECELPELTRQSVGQVPTLENKHHPTIPIYYIYICWNIPPKIHTYVVTYLHTGSNHLQTLQKIKIWNSISQMC